MTHLLDSSAVLAWLRSEDGAGLVEEHLTGGVVTAFNLSEILRTADRLNHPVTGRHLASDLSALGIHYETTATAGDAVRAAELITLSYVERAKAKAADPDAVNGTLSYGDAWCIAVGERLQLRVLTAERSWRTLEPHLKTPIALIR